MDWQLRLISLYLFVCKHFPKLHGYCMRYSNYADLSFTDEEVLTVYLFGVLAGRRSIKEIHSYADQHLREFFPKLSGYKAYDARINQLYDVFVPLIELIQREALCELPSEKINITDSMPIIMVQRGRRFQAKVAPEIASANGYCATKKMHYYGVKLHVVGTRRAGKLPLPNQIGLTHAGVHDRKAYEQIEPEVQSKVFADKAYQIGNTPLLESEHYTLYTPPKKEKGQILKDATDALLTTAIASVRQPIESFFNWINEKTGIQIASKVRSYKGLMVHVFGKIAAACLILFKPI